jgi:methionyl-tRNA formyltransferase
MGLDAGLTTRTDTFPTDFDRLRKNRILAAMRILYMGTPDFAVPALATLLDNGYEVVAVVTAPDKPAGRGLQMKASPVKEFALRKGLRILQPEKLKDPAFLDTLQSLDLDLAIVVAFRMLPEVVWRLPKKGTFNLHASLLPQYRGAAPINWAVMNGETQTGLTTFFLEKEIDTGEILMQQQVEIPDEWTAGQLHDHLMQVGAELVLQTVRGIAAQQLHPTPQILAENHRPAPKIFKETCEIKWGRTAKEVYDFIRGLSPFPTAWTTVDGKQWKIFKARKTMEATAIPPGSLQLHGGKLRVACSDEWLEITELQMEGKSKMDTASFLNGYKGGLEHAG